jgi:hypothetical protein
MKHILLIAALGLAACAGGTPNADSARTICTQNGHTLGSPAFDRCFESTYSAIMGGGRRSQPSTVCSTVGTTTICS